MTGACSRPAETGWSRLRLLRAGGLLLVAAVLLAVAPPASAHQSDPRIVTTLDEVTPRLPDGVVVQVQASLAAQLVADNPTSTPLEVLGIDGEPFLRLSSAGVEADVASPDFLSTSNPNGGAAAQAGGSEPRWVRISAGTSWGWFDHRLHPDELRAPVDDRRAGRLGQWSVPMRYGDEPVEVTGSVRFEPLLGGFVVDADPVPAGLVVQALPGRLPGVFLSNPERRPITVLGRDGEPFLRFGPRGMEVNTVSRTHVEDRRARGQDAGPPSPEPRFEVVDPTGTSYTWLDVRLRYPDDRPPERVLRAAEPTVVSTWEIPVEGLAISAFTGEVRWLPDRAAVEADAGAGADDGGLAPTTAVLAGTALLVLGGVVALLRRRRAGTPGT